MISDELLRAIRNDLPMKVTLQKLGRQAPVSKQVDGYYRYICLECGEFRATVNPSCNLAHCFSCGQNLNKIDLLMELGYEFREAVAVLEQWLRLYRQHRTASKT